METETYIHILRGTGDNCTCRDCVVLYGGSCYSTPDNNMLDEIEKTLRRYLKYTHKGKERVKSGSYAEKSIEEVISPIVRNRCGIKKADFNECFYGWLPMVYFMQTSYRSDKTRNSYRLARYWLYRDIVRSYRESERKVYLEPVNNPTTTPPQ